MKLGELEELKKGLIENFYRVKESYKGEDDRLTIVPSTGFKNGKEHIKNRQVLRREWDGRGHIFDEYCLTDIEFSIEEAIASSLKSIHNSEFGLSEGDYQKFLIETKNELLNRFKKGKYGISINNTVEVIDLESFINNDNASGLFGKEYQNLRVDIETLIEIEKIIKPQTVGQEKVSFDELFVKPENTHALLSFLKSDVITIKRGMKSVICIIAGILIDEGYIEINLRKLGIVVEAIRKELSIDKISNPSGYSPGQQQKKDFYKNRLNEILEK